MYVQILKNSGSARYEEFLALSNDIIAVARDCPGFVECKLAGFPVAGRFLMINCWRQLEDADLFLTERMSPLSEKLGWQFQRLDDYIPAYEVITSS